jgi:flagellar biosynthesis protein FliP
MRSTTEPVAAPDIVTGLVDIGPSRRYRRTRAVARRVVVFVIVATVAFAYLVATAAPSAAQAVIEPIPEIEFAPTEAEATTGSGIAITEPAAVTAPDVGISIEGEGGLTQTVVIILLLTIGSIAPSILLLTTCFTRFAIVLSLTRNALGTQQVPPTQVLTGLALFLTLFVMGPIFQEINSEAIQPLLNGEIDQGEAWEIGFEPLGEFMLAQTSDEDLRLFIDLRNEPVTSADDVDPTVLIPAFVLSELRTAFTIGFMIFIPFLVIDLVVSSVLMALGMVMLPPVFISLPIKLLLFVLVDGWGLIVQSMVASVNQVT